MRIVEALEGKGFRLPLMKGEVELAEKLAAITRQVAGLCHISSCLILWPHKLNIFLTLTSQLQLKGSGAELSRRVQNLLTLSRVQANSFGGSVFLPGSTKIHEQSLTDMQEVSVTILELKISEGFVIRFATVC